MFSYECRNVSVFLSVFLVNCEVFHTWMTPLFSIWSFMQIETRGWSPLHAAARAPNKGPLSRKYRLSLRLLDIIIIKVRNWAICGFSWHSSGYTGKARLFWLLVVRFHFCLVAIIYISCHQKFTYTLAFTGVQNSFSSLRDPFATLGDSHLNWTQKLALEFSRENFIFFLNALTQSLTNEYTTGYSWSLSPPKVGGKNNSVDVDKQTHWFLLWFFFFCCSFF